MLYLRNQAISMLTAYLSLALVPALLFPFGIAIGIISIFITIICWLLSSGFLIRNLKQLFIHSLLSVAIFSAGSLASATIYDMGFDAMWYHQPGIIHLKEGWNPVYETINKDVEPTCSRNLNHLPKAAWIAAAQVYKIWDNIEASKVLTGWLMITSFFWVAYALTRLQVHSRIQIFFMALLVSFNPISINQLASSYVDGQLGGIFLCILALGLLLYLEFKKNLLLLLLGSFVVFANIKFTATAITGFSFLLSFIFLFLTKKTFRFFLVSSYTLAMLALSVWAGYSPFVKNTLTKHDPLYPVFEKDFFEQDKIYPNQFEGSNRFSRFYLSVLAKPAYPSKGTDIEQRKLFRNTVVSPFGDSSPLVGSFGPISAEIILITLVLFIISSAIRFKDSVPYWLITGYLFITIFINSEAWLGRYSPQFWMIICLMLWFVSQTGYLKYGFWIIGIAMCINAYMIGRTHLQANTAETKKLFYYINQISSNPNAVIDPGWTSGYQHRIKKLGIPEKQRQWLSQQDPATQIIDKDLGVGFKPYYDFGAMQP